MRLRSLLKSLIDTRFLVTGASKTEYEHLYLKIDYLLHERFQQQYKSWKQLQEENPKVRYICYNAAAGCIEIEIE